MDVKEFLVQLGDRSYPVVVGSGCINNVAAYVADEVKKVAIVTQEEIGIEISTGRNQKVFNLPSGERAKSIEVIKELCSSWVQWGLTRADTVLALGGGVVTDVASFAASIYHRGVSVINVPTSLLGMVDAAIGGKTGVNLPEGKNLIGTFWQPNAVICDVDTLETLPEREWKCGYGEIAKYHFIGAGDLREMDLVSQIIDCVKLKTDIVAQDERESGKRAILNYGHTLAHALELENQFSLAHGEAVAVGIRYAAEVAYQLDRIDRKRVQYHEEILNHYGLSYSLPSQINEENIISLFSRDKKAQDGVTFVLDGESGVEIVKVRNKNILEKALEVIQ
ncbi:MAG: 3-dehydroquinate synthase family protein [Actinomycetota bacterium]|nr:3-dehydroquinate synthase family protein [Actinomycetota bacterium]